MALGFERPGLPRGPSQAENRNDPDMLAIFRSLRYHGMVPQDPEAEDLRDGDLWALTDGTLRIRVGGVSQDVLLVEGSPILVGAAGTGPGGVGRALYIA